MSQHTSKALPSCNIKTLYSLGYGLPVCYVPATFCMLNATMGIRHKKFVSVILHLVSAHQMKDLEEREPFVYCCAKMYWLTLSSPCISDCWDKDQYNLLLVVQQVGEK